MKNLMRSLGLLVIIALAVSCGTTKEAPGTVTLSYGDVRFEGGNGKNFKQAVRIEGAESTKDGVEAEMYYIESHFGKRGDDWILLSKGQQEKDGVHYDIVEIGIEGNDRSEIIYFDISDFYGKM